MALLKTGASQRDRQREGKGGLLSHCGRVVGNSGSIEGTGRKKTALQEGRRNGLWPLMKAEIV